MSETEDEKDAAAARAYFDEWIAPGLEGLPDVGIEHLRERYVKDLMKEPGARAQMRELYGEKSEHGGAGS